MPPPLAPIESSPAVAAALAAARDEKVVPFLRYDHVAILSLPVHDVCAHPLFVLLQYTIPWP
jgi:hypothetical protein